MVEGAAQKQGDMVYENFEKGRALKTRCFISRRPGG
ncbi:predicted protein [Sclerotinia sclerotiorum 1980 UF-70]|uniref:Uncharacterized protein n=1 Tax=Sclerotinia sclerotiorum (strain ATCC 18683 / 1980 / Ss-1) TaxID=665079 RepID=A7ENQ3_SCLS1|nr:predicted protein [Sclerotinia sclerotiorum 1980 UF-70]EDO04469.1 predicted protein [Sclerotinia sclerotiorum 1980 UF-70]